MLTHVHVNFSVVSLSFIIFILLMLLMFFFLLIINFNKFKKVTSVVLTKDGNGDNVICKQNRTCDNCYVKTSETKENTIIPV